MVDGPKLQPSPSPPSPIKTKVTSQPTTALRLLVSFGLLLVMVIVIVVAQRVGWANLIPGCPKDTFCVSAERILRAYSDDFDAAQETYAGQSIIVTGTLESAIINDTGDYSAMITPRSNGGLGQPFLGCRDLPLLDVKVWKTNHPNNWNVRLAGVVKSGGMTANGVLYIALAECRLVH